MVSYDLSHLIQSSDQYVSGPIQDDEALLLYAMVRTMKLGRVLEFGGLSGYSAKNFLVAVGEEGAVYTVDLCEVPAQAKNHKIIVKNARLVSGSDVDSIPLDLVFFDCHSYKSQMEAFFNLSAGGLITKNTVLALHDTNLHPAKFAEWSVETEGGFVHQPVERQMVDDLSPSYSPNQPATIALCIRNQYAHTPPPTGFIVF